MLAEINHDGTVDVSAFLTAPVLLGVAVLLAVAAVLYRAATR
jgi:hypothetical protein